MPRFATRPGGHGLDLGAAKYYLFFTNIKVEVLDLVKNWSSELWRLNRENKIQEAYIYMKSMIDSISGYYDITTVTRIDVTGFEYYCPSDHHIGLPKPSLVSLLHEYRHHMQTCGLGHYDNIEDDARGWSHSVFAQALPNIFDKSWREGKIWFLPPYNTNWKQEMN